MQLYKEKMRQEDAENKCIAPKAEVCLLCSRNSQETTKYVGEKGATDLGL